MQVQAVHGAAPMDIYPAVGHGERASGEIQLQPARERRDVTIGSRASEANVGDSRCMRCAEL